MRLQIGGSRPVFSLLKSSAANVDGAIPGNVHGVLLLLLLLLLHCALCLTFFYKLKLFYDNP